MVAITSGKYQNLATRKKQLQDEQDRLKKLLKEKYPSFYSWLSENKIDPADLGVYSVNIAAAFMISVSSASTLTSKINLIDTQPSKSQQVDVIDQSELIGLSDAEKAAIVWERYGDVINEVADLYKVDPKLIFATIMLESGGNALAIRQEPTIGDASYGLGQILYGTAKGVGFKGKPNDLLDVRTNLELVAIYHSRNMRVYGPKLTHEQLTIAYNTGSPYNQPLPGHIYKFNNWYREARHLII